MKKQISLREKKDNFAGAFLALPITVWIALIVFYPIISTVYTSMTNQKLFGSPYDFVFLDTYKWVFEQSAFIQATINSLNFAVTSVIFQVIFGVLTALLLNMEFKGRGFFRTWIILPWAIPYSVIAIIFRWILSSTFGVINYVLTELNLISESINFLGSMDFAMTTTIAVNIWKWFPFASVIFLAALQGIPSDVFEAARIDGCNKIQEFYYLIIPALKAPIAVYTLLLTFWSFNTFGLIWLLTAGGPADVTTTLPVLVYKMAFRQFRMGAASALSIIMFIILMIFTIIYRKVVKNTNDEVGA